MPRYWFKVSHDFWAKHTRIIRQMKVTDERIAREKLTRRAIEILKPADDNVFEATVKSARVKLGAQTKGITIVISDKDVEDFSELFGRYPDCPNRSEFGAIIARVACDDLDGS